MDDSFYKNLLDDLYDGVYFVDQHRRIQYWNNGAERISGYSAGEVVGSYCHANILRHIDGRGVSLCRTACPLAATIRDGQSREVEVFLHHKAGHRVPVKVRVSPLVAPNGTIIGATEVFSDNSPQAVMAQRIEELTQLAMLDTTTGLPNRRYLERKLEAGLDELRRYETRLAVLFMDLDHFKQINDSYGHDVGDAVLQMVGATLTHALRPLDQVGRWGGEEFVAIVRSVDERALASIAERFRALIEGSSLPHGGEEIHVTLSIGGVIARPDDTLDTLLKRADTLLYHSKSSGRNRVTLRIDE